MAFCRRIKYRRQQKQPHPARWKNLSLGQDLFTRLEAWPPTEGPPRRAAREQAVLRHWKLIVRVMFWAARDGALQRALRTLVSPSKGWAALLTIVPGSCLTHGWSFTRDAGMAFLRPYPSWPIPRARV